MKIVDQFQIGVGIWTILFTVSITELQDSRYCHCWQFLFDSVIACLESDYPMEDVKGVIDNYRKWGFSIEVFII